jgi:hypothetical protein
MKRDHASAAARRGAWPLRRLGMAAIFETRAAMSIKMLRLPVFS